MPAKRLNRIVARLHAELSGRAREEYTNRRFRDPQLPGDDSVGAPCARRRKHLLLSDAEWRGLVLDEEQVSVTALGELGDDC
jgi:hypothetical protein